MGTRTLKQIKASRRNGVQSRGPLAAKRTAELLESRQQLLAGTVLLPGEAEDRFLSLMKSMFEEWRPGNESEAALVENMIMARWRLLRVAGLQASEIGRSMARLEGPGPTRAMDAIAGREHAFDSYQRREGHYDRQYHRALRALTHLRQQRNRPGQSATSTLSTATSTWPIGVK